MKNYGYKKKRRHCTCVDIYSNEINRVNLEKNEHRNEINL